MKTIDMLCQRIGRRISIGWLTTVFLLSGSILFFSCEQASPKANKVEDEIAMTKCFSKTSLQETPWVRDQLVQFQRPKSGSLRVVVFSYQNEQYLAFGNGFVSSPASYIFNCSGVNLPTLKINYNQFTDQAKEVEVLLEETY